MVSGAYCYCRAFCIEYWATNSLTVTVGPLTTLLYHIRQGWFSPQWNIGSTNFLSDYYWRYEVNYLGTNNIANNYYSANKDYVPNVYNNNILPLIPLTINGTNYSKGLSFAWWINNYGSTNQVEFPLGGVSGTFSTVFGLNDGADGVTAVQLKVMVDGVQQFKSGWVSNNAAQATNISFQLNQANTIGFILSENVSNKVSAVLGNCQLVVTGARTKIWPSHTTNEFNTRIDIPSLTNIPPSALTPQFSTNITVTGVGTFRFTNGVLGGFTP